MNQRVLKLGGGGKWEEVPHLCDSERNREGRRTVSPSAICSTYAFSPGAALGQVHGGPRVSSQHRGSAQISGRGRTCASQNYIRCC